MKEIKVEDIVILANLDKMPYLAHTGIHGKGLGKGETQIVSLD